MTWTPVARGADDYYRVQGALPARLVDYARHPRDLPNVAGRRCGLVLVFACAIVALDACGGGNGDGDRTAETGDEREATRINGCEIKPRTECFEADLAGADLSGAKLSRAVLVRADLSGADLSGADLTGAVLASATLVDADLRGADLSGAEIGLAVMNGSKLGDASLDDVHFGEASAPFLIGAEGLTDEQLAAMVGAEPEELAKVVTESGLRLDTPEDIATALAAACAGSPVDAVRRAPAGSGFHPVLEVHAPGLPELPAGNESRRGQFLPSEWAPTSVRFAELALCVEEDSFVEIDQCQYVDGSGSIETLPHYREHLRVRLVEARTATTTAEMAFDAEVLELCPEYVASGFTYLDSVIQTDDVLTFVAEHVGNDPPVVED